MKVLIPFSGGLDSTYLACQTLKKGNSVVLPYFEIQNNKNKARIEKIHRGLIIELLKKEFPDHAYDRIKDLGSAFSLSINTGSVTGEMVLIQPPLWIMGVSFIDSNLYDEIHMAYVMEDHALSYLNEIRTLSRAYLPFKHKDKQKNNCIKFPLIKIHKNEIVEELPEIIQRLTWTCENPQILYESNKFMIYCACEGDSYRGCVACNHRTALRNNIWKGMYYIYHKSINSLGKDYQKENLEIVDSYKLEEFLKFNSRNNNTLLELLKRVIDKNKTQLGSVEGVKSCERESLEEISKEPTKHKIIEKHGKNKKVISKPKRKR